MSRDRRSLPSRLRNGVWRAVHDGCGDDALSAVAKRAAATAATVIMSTPPIKDMPGTDTKAPQSAALVVRAAQPTAEASPPDVAGVESAQQLSLAGGGPSQSPEPQGEPAGGAMVEPPGLQRGARNRA